LINYNHSVEWIRGNCGC